MIRRLRFAPCLALALLAGTLVVAQEAARIPIVDAPPGTPSIGGGFRLGSNPYTDDEGTLDLVPLYLYEGKYLFAHGTSGGVHMYRNSWFSFDAFAQYRFLKLDPADDPSLAGLFEREQTVDAGLSVGARGKWGGATVRWMTDVLDRHNGEQLEATYRYQFKRGRWLFSPYVTFEWQDQDLAGYYFGVSPVEATPTRPVYSPGSVFNLNYGLNTSFAFHQNILVFANFSAREWDADIVASPIAAEAITIVAFVGANYVFGNVYDPKTGTERKKEWTWRLNYGYQASGNIVGEINTGDFSKSSFADTNLAGFTYGRLVNDGPRVDFYARLAIFRHLERGAQDDFNSYAAYIMAMGKNYLAWTDRPFFRWGFGFGFNYAEEVPIVEQIKQGRRGRETNQFLNYLEMQLDFSIDAITGGHGGSFRNCYLGTTAVHRSGMWATSDILGNVSGGSDWITVHLECLQ